jgi:hypothetical protein
MEGQAEVLEEDWELEEEADGAAGEAGGEKISFLNYFVKSSFFAPCVIYSV